MHIFVAFPFSQLINEKTGLVRNDYIEFLDKIRNRILEEGNEVFLAHYRENWGKDLMGPMECTPDDYRQMQGTDLVLAFPGSPISGGVHIELGWASALGKKIVLFLKDKAEYSPLVFGISTICEAEIHYYDELDYEKLLPLIKQYISGKNNELSA